MRKLWRSGEPFIWLTGGALALALIMVAGLIGIILLNALGFFWPADVVRLTLRDGKTLAGPVVERERIPGMSGHYRIKLKVANRDLYGADFVWVDEAQIVDRARPADVAVIERTEWGLLIGTITALREGERILASVTAGPEVEALRAQMTALQELYKGHETRLAGLRARQTTALVVAVEGGKEKVLPLTQVLDVYFPNRMSVAAKSLHYLASVWEFVSADPRESNTEGGVFPAIYGTVMMVLIMSVMVTPLGVLAAFYLREYARQGAFVSAVRIAVNNLAGVPSIVFGVFGVGFFIYLVGGTIDQLFFAEALPTPTFGTGGILWASLTLALLTIPVVIVATEEGLAAIPGGAREASLALGATKLETTLRVVLPAVMPSILTGLILAMARAAGEVAPLMITGVVKLAPSLPIDGTWPFLHLDRKFMHLGFHIYDVGFQSPNVDAARPMVFTTTLLLLTIVVLMNLFAITLRNRLRRKYASAAV